MDRLIWGPQDFTLARVVVGCAMGFRPSACVHLLGVQSSFIVIFRLRKECERQHPHLLASSVDVSSEQYATGGGCVHVLLTS